MTLKFIRLSRIVELNLIFLLSICVSGQITTVVPSNKSGDLKINQSALPVLENSPLETVSKMKTQNRGSKLSVLTEKLGEVPNPQPDFFCSTPNSYVRPKGKFDVKAVGALDCGANGRTPCYWTKPFIFIGFINGTPELKKLVSDVIVEWTTYANVGFIADDNANYTGDTADIKIYFSPNSEYNSFVGIDSWQSFLKEDKNTPTMKLGFINETVRNTDGSIVPWVKGTILHEFGHALGLKHEHQNPSVGIQWNRDAVIKDLSGPPNNWTIDIIENNIFKALNRTYTQYTQHDPSSIMHYSFPASWTQNGIAITENDELSETDKMFIASKYPRRKAAINASQYYRLTTWYNNKRNCLSIATSSTNTGKTYFPYFVACDNTSSAQLWKLTPVANGDYRISNFLTGNDLSLNDDGVEYYTAMRPSGNYSGQFWTITSLDKYFHLSSANSGIYFSFTSETAPNSRLYMNRTAHWSNQLWEFIPAGAVK